MINLPMLGPPQLKGGKDTIGERLPPPRLMMFGIVGNMTGGEVGAIGAGISVK
jgi:hypothetical protein